MLERSVSVTSDVSYLRSRQEITLSTEATRGRMV